LVRSPSLQAGDLPRPEFTRITSNQLNKLLSVDLLAKVTVKVAVAFFLNRDRENFVFHAAAGYGVAQKPERQSFPSRDFSKRCVILLSSFARKHLRLRFTGSRPFRCGRDRANGPTKGAVNLTGREFYGVGNGRLSAGIDGSGVLPDSNWRKDSKLLKSGQIGLIP
jgi:hypothetical protein